MGNDGTVKKGGPRIEPIVGVTCSHDRKRQPDQYHLAGAYCRAVEKAGGIPVLLPAVTRLERPLASFCQGLLLSGGGDFDPVFFGELPHPVLGTVDYQRDCWEILLINKARREGLPILGICRGMQAINIALGGSLYQDLSSQYPVNGKQGLLGHQQSAPGDQVTHRVKITVHSLLHRIVNSTEIWTNSHHHQAVKETAPGLKVTAWSEDGVIEGIEGEDDRFLLGVQWHPERLATPESERLFAAFVAACHGKMALV